MHEQRLADDRAQEAARHLETVYGRIDAKRMHDLPIRNATLRVEAVGFRPWEGHVLGVLITPWCMNLILMPGVEDDWRHLARASTSSWDFPAGAFQFDPCLFDEIDLHLSAPLFSTVQDFPDQATARSIADEIIRNLLDPAMAAARTSTAGAGDHHDDALPGNPVSRRGLLRRLALLDQ